MKTLFMYSHIYLNFYAVKRFIFTKNSNVDRSSLNDGINIFADALYETTMPI